MIRDKIITYLEREIEDANHGAIAAHAFDPNGSRELIANVTAGVLTRVLAKYRALVAIEDDKEAVQE